MQRYACTLTHLKFHAEQTSVLFLELMVRTIRSNARHRSSKLCYSILERVKDSGLEGRRQGRVDVALAVSRRGKKKRGGNGWTERDLGRKRGGDDIRRISRWETRLVNDDRDSWSGERPCYGNGGPLSCQLGAQVQTTGEQWDKLCKRGVTASSTSLPTFLPTYVAKNEPAGTWCDFRHRFHGSSRVIHTNRTIR